MSMGLNYPRIYIILTLVAIGFKVERRNSYVNPLEKYRLQILIYTEYSKLVKHDIIISVRHG